jgi:hypothetical protein
MRVEMMTAKGPVDVKGHKVGVDGLAATYRRSNRTWSLTHVESGLMVAGMLDWTQGKDSIMTEQKAQARQWRDAFKAEVKRYKMALLGLPCLPTNGNMYYLDSVIESSPCTNCGYSWPVEPDASRYKCHECGEGTVSSPLVLAGLI